MIANLVDFFNSERFMPHGHCFLWEPDILWLHVLSDGGIVAAYLGIPLALIYLLYKRKDLKFENIFLLFAAFILLCGVTHAVSIWVLWYPDYAIQGILKAITAIVSILTLFALIKLVPRILLIPTPTQLHVAEKHNRELRAMEEKLLQYTHDLEHSNEELEEFAYVASHDLKAPLRGIDTVSKWLEEDLKEHFTPKTKEYLDMLQGRVSRMEKLLDDLLGYSRIGRTIDGTYSELITGDELMDNVMKLLSAPEGFDINVGPNFSAITVNRMPLQQILMNLISNAIKHHDKKKGTIKVTVEDKGSSYAFAVQDDGPGIPEQFHEQVFKMFQTLKPRDRVEGSGMGLAMVRKYIDVFGGTIRLDSSEGHGSIFRFTWPKRSLKPNQLIDKTNDKNYELSHT